MLIWSFALLIAAFQTEVESAEDNLQHLSIEELMKIKIISSTQDYISLSEAPSTVYVVQGDDLRRWGIRRISELVERLVPGAISAEDFDDIILAFRGISPDSNSKVLLLINGHDYNTQWNNGPSSEAELGMLDDIDRIEVLVGPHTALYGSSALIGVINLITKNGQSFEGLKVNGAYGDGDFKRGGFIVGGRAKERIHYFFSAGGLTADGYTNNHNEPLNISRFPPTFRFYGNLRYGELEVMSRFTRSSRAFYIQNTSTITPNVWTNYDTFFVVARKKFLVSDEFSHSLKLSYDTIQTQRHDFTIGTKLRGIGEDRFGVELTSHYSGLKRHQLLWGGYYRRDEFGNDWEGDNFNFTTTIIDGEVTGIPSDPFSKRVLTPYGRNAYALFGQDSIKIANHLSLLLGLRYDRVEAPQIKEPDSFSPRLALVATPNTKTVLKVMYSGGVSRQLNASATSPDPISFGNPTIAAVEGPEKLSSVEVAASYQMNPFVNLSLSTFYNIFKDIIGIDPKSPSPPFIFINAGRIDYTGFEAAANLNPTPKTLVRLIQQHVQFGSVVDDPFGLLTTSDNKHPSNYPENLSKILVDYQINRNLSVNANANLIWNSFATVEAGGTEGTGFYSLLNASIGWKPTSDFEIWLHGYNLLNEQKRTTPYIFLFPRVTLNSILPRRNFNVELNYSF